MYLEEIIENIQLESDKFALSRRKCRVQVPPGSLW